MTAICRLFKGIDPVKLKPLLAALNVIKRSYGVGQIIMEQGAKTDCLGVVEKGFVDALHYTSDGNASLISHFSAGQIFADFLAASDSKESPVTLIARENSDVLFVPISALYSPMNDFENEARILTANLVGIYADQYFELKDRIFCITAPTLKEKILRFLFLFSDKAKSNTFYVPYSRERMAAYLNAERSALSRELMRMKAEGIIDCRGKLFILKINR